MTEKILVVDDEQDLLLVLDRSLTRKGYEVQCAESGEAAWKSIEETMFDLVISDLAMDDLNGLELLKRVRAADSTLPFIIMTGVGTIESAVDAIKLGAYQYITKPFKMRDIEVLTQRALEYGKLHRKLDSIRLHEEDDSSAEMIIGSSKSMQNLLRQVEKISDSDAPVLIQGETGTGKSLLAKKIHESSSRRDNPFQTIDCGSLKDTLLESELFGHVKGSFTGAIRAKRGLMEEAQGGTIFLDEISEITLQTQVKLLRAIQEKDIRPVGGNKSIPIDVRFISATNRNLKEETDNESFRKDLYYRLAVVPLYLPPLRDRKEDIPQLIEFLLEKYQKRYRKKISHIRSNVLHMLRNAPWKGNIRELANILERGVLLAENETLTLDCLFTAPDGIFDGEDKGRVVTLKDAVESAEINAIKNALESTENNRTQAARVLGISRRALYDKIAAYDLNL